MVGRFGLNLAHILRALLRGWDKISFRKLNTRNYWIYYQRIS